MNKELEYKTFDEWSLLGYSVMKYSKGKKKNGKFLFSEGQVYKPSVKNSYYDWTENKELRVRNYLKST